MHVLHVTIVDETSKEDNSQRCSVIFNEFPYVSLEQSAFAEHTTDITAHQHKKGDHDAQIRRGISREVPLSGQYLDPLLEVDKGNIKSENITGKSSHVGEGVASISDGKDPVENQRPTSSKAVSSCQKNPKKTSLQSNPEHERKIISTSRGHDIVNGVVENSNRT